MEAKTQFPTGGGTKMEKTDFSKQWKHCFIRDGEVDRRVFAFLSDVVLDIMDQARQPSATGSWNESHPQWWIVEHPQYDNHKDERIKEYIPGAMIYEQSIISSLASINIPFLLGIPDILYGFFSHVSFPLCVFNFRKCCLNTGRCIWISTQKVKVNIHKEAKDLMVEKI
jgi:hypothetical protein